MMMVVHRGAAELADLLRGTMGGMLSGLDDAALMFSGGLDSALLAVLSRKRTDIVAYVSGLEGSHDILWARKCAAIMDLPLTELAFTEDDVLRSLEDVIKKHGVREPKWISTFVLHDLTFQRIRERVVITGNGADELFGGYAKYLRDPDPVERMGSDTNTLLEKEFPAYESMARRYGKTLLAPYLDPVIVNFAADVPFEMKVGDGGNKLILRDAARLSGVPEMMAGKAKKAMQYGSGVSKVIKSHLRCEGIGLREFIESIPK